MPDPRASIGTLRALSALFLFKILHPALVMIAIVLIALYTLTILLTLTFSNWWLLTLTVLIPITILILICGYIVWYLLHKLLPRKLSSEEQAKLHKFTDKLWGVAEQVRLPYPVLLFLVAKDVLRGKESKFLRKIIGDSHDLMKEFGEIQDLFRK